MEYSQYNFSEELIKKCQKLVYERSGKKITPGEADICLDRLARLGELAVKVLGKEKEAKIKK
ncbi:MAG: hypothetical protein PHF35_04255 [Candidatus Moranbacteria bacterium]|nr:hypothetical protein [Candidatus Moranbacteria bacterium]